jgi:hypothetical protein
MPAGPAMSKVAAPVVNPGGGSFTDQVTISLNSATNGATVYYTTDGSAPTANSIQYGSPFVLSSNATIKAIAMKSGAQNSDMTIASFVVQATATPPVISGVTANGITDNSALINWTTSKPSDTQVEYGTTTACNSATPLDTAALRAHSVTLSALNANTTYYYRVRSKDAAGSLAVSPNFTFKTPSAADTTAPVISAATASTGSTSAAISWNTNEGSTSEVLYGTTTALGSTTGQTNTLVTSHTATINGLNQNTTYYWRVRSKDAAGNVASSSVAVFKTSGDATPPKLHNIVAAPTTTGATIKFTSSEPARCYVRYGPTRSYGSVTATTGLQTQFAIPIAGLKSRTFYNFQVHCEDAALNAMDQPNRSFTTK